MPSHTSLVDWVDKKTQRVYDKFEEFFKTHENDKLDTINVYPIFESYFKIDNNLKKTKDRLFDDADELQYCIDQYIDIMAYINEKNVVYLPSKRTFSSFMGLTISMYNKLLNDSTIEIMEVMNNVEDYIIGAKINAAERGLTRSGVTKLELQMDSKGHGLVTAKEKNTIDSNKKKLLSSDELMKNLENFGVRNLEELKKP